MTYYNDFDTDNIKDAAKNAAGNWRKFDSFVWYGDSVDDPQNCFIFYPSHRDSDLLDVANHKAIVNRLQEKFPDSDLWWQESHSHWAVDYANAIVIRVYVGKKITEVFTDLMSVFYDLQQYPVLDDDLFSELEYDALFDNTADCIHGLGLDIEESDDLTSEVLDWLHENHLEETENIDGIGAYPSEDIVRLFFEANND